MPPRFSLLILAGSLLAVLSSCVPAAPSPIPPTRTATPPPATPPLSVRTATSPSTPPTAAAYIDYRRTGGIAGFDDHLVVDAQAHAVLTRRKGKSEFELTRDELMQLEAAFRDANFASIPEKSDQPPMPDGFTYMLTYEGHTVRLSDPSLPQNLAPAIRLLNNIIDAKGK